MVYFRVVFTLMDVMQEEKYMEFLNKVHDWLIYANPVNLGGFVC